MKYFLGVDGGGTKIAVALRPEDGGAVRVARVPGANLEVKGVEAVYALIKRGVRKLARGRKIELSGARFCLCGIDFPRDAEMAEPYFREHLKRDFGYAGPMSFENDAFAALRAGTSARPGFIISLGTGFTIAAIDARGRERLVCDYQVKNLLNTMVLGVSSAAHGLLPGNKPSRLLGEIMRLARCRTPYDLLARLWAVDFRKYARPLPQELKFKFVPLFYKYYAKGDPLAVMILGEYAERIGRALAALKKFAGGEGAVVFSGSFFIKYPRESAFFRREILRRAGFRRARQVTLEKEPVHGAVLP
ncbi:MAG: BadF/BadG/BcrA/BcrD ATPase family protein [Elusimicrobiales bacterium]|nr:BadF/BadG/BcrA/BcrD ATPase family protein [Elusimicrobiales bacterium]